MDNFAHRDARQNADEDAWRLARDEPSQYDLDEHRERMILTDCAVQVDAVNDIAATVDLLIQSAANPNEQEPRAQGIEDLCYAWLDELDMAMGTSGQPDIRHAVSHSAHLFGWLTALTRFAPEKLFDAQGQFQPTACPFVVELVDPRTVYPDTYDGAPTVITHQYSASPARLEERFGKRAIGRVLAELGHHGNKKPDTLDCIGFYTNTDWALLAGNTWIRSPKPHEYGFNPLLMLTVGGSPFRGPRPSRAGRDANRWAAYRTDRRSGSDNWDEYVGVSFLRAIRPVVEDAQKIATMQRELLERAANPPSGFLTVDGRDIDIELPLRSGESYTGRQGDSYTEHQPHPQAMATSMQLRTLQQAAIQMAGINAALLGGGPAPSGFDRVLLQQASLRRLRPYLKMQSLFWRVVFQRFMQLATRFLPLQMPITFLAQNPETGEGRLAQLTPMDLMGADVSLKVEFGDPGLQDKVMLGGLGVQLMSAGIASPQYVLGELLKERNPTKILQERERFEMKNHPAIKAIRGLWDMAENDPDPLNRMMATQLRDMEMQRFSVLHQQTMNPPMQPGVTAPPTASPPGMPEQALPNEMQQGAGMLPNAPAPPGMQQEGAPLPAPMPPM
jgi:hypothetical protein